MTPSKGIYVPRGTRTKWVAEHAGKHDCQCGCGDPVLVRTGHYPDVPRFRHGHNARSENSNTLPDGGTRAAWAAAEQGLHACACGCGTAVRVLPEHHSVGIPKYVNNHHPRPRPRKPVAPPRECRCGCGQWTAAGSQYIHGHNSRPPPLKDVFLSKTSPLLGDHCWPWYGHFQGKGYAVFRYRGKHRSGARVAFSIFRGPIPPRREADHTCRMRGCVNPWHLDAVTHAENIRRMRLSAEEHRALAPKRPPDWTP